MGDLCSRGVAASVTPYATRHARLTLCVYNAPGDVEAALRVVRELA